MTSRRGFIFSLLAGLVLVAGTIACVRGPAAVAYWNYSPQEGDIIFQSLPHCALVDAIEGVSGSAFSHCGVVAHENDEWVVYEALAPVGATQLGEFVDRGRGRAFAVYRLRDEFRRHIPALLDAVRSYTGRPYDARYRLDDDNIYCSELIWKAYRTASGAELGRLVRLGDLNWRPFIETIEYYEGAAAPLDRKMITPIELARAPQLRFVCGHGFD